MCLAFSFPNGGYLKPLPSHLSLSRVPVGLFSQPLPLFSCSPGSLAPTPNFRGSPNWVAASFGEEH